MDETAFHETRRKVNLRPCVFERGILSRHCTCLLAVRHAIAEREAVGCTDAAAHDTCAAFLALLREKSLFALKLADAGERLPHAKLMKLVCGGLAGVQRVLYGAEVVSDVSGLLAAARARYGGLDALPYPQIMRSVVHFEPRRRRAPGEA